jgi:hypothetical protein
MTEPTNVELRNALNRFRASAAGKGAPESLEAALTDAYRAQHARKITKFRKWFWVPAAVAASLVVGIAWRLSTPAAIPNPPRIVASIGAPAAILRNEPKSAPVRRTVRAKARAVSKTRRSVRAPDEVEASETPRRQPEVFVEIPYAPPFSAYDGGQVVRVNMPGSSVRRLGLPVSVDRVQADVLLGNDGIARAIRLVSNSGLNSGR